MSEDEIKQLVEEKEQYRQELIFLSKQYERINQDLRDFGSIVSHDLKGPLRNMSTVLGWLETDHSENMNDEGKEYVELLKDKTKQLYSIIEDVLTYLRLINENIEIKEVDLNRILKEIVALHEASGKLNLTYPELPTITGNEILISQVFGNIIDNATVFTDKEQATVTLNVDEEDNYWKFSISDDGEGLAEHALDKIFTIFQKYSLKSRGTGVGLAHVKKIVESLGGKVWVESELGQGATFYFTWPK